MTQRFDLCNKTKKVILSYIIKSWAFGTWEWDEILKVMKWDKTDEIFGLGDKGDVITYHNGEEKFTESKDVKFPESLNCKDYQRKYIWGNNIFDRDITQEEWQTFLKTGTCKLWEERDKKL